MAGLTGYFGGKNSMSSWIYSYIPKNIKTYCEVFSGSFAIYFNEDFDHCENIIYNDANKWQTNFISCCKDYNRIISEIKKSFESGYLFCDKTNIDEIKKHYRDLYTDIKNPIKSDFYDNDKFNIPDYEKAVIYSFMITSAFNSCHARGAGFSGFSKTNKLKLNTLLNKLNKIEYQNKLNKITNVECMDFEDVINKYDSESSFFYLDPPYKYTNGVGTHDKDYGSKDIFGDSSHERLAKILSNCKSKWALSYYYFPELEEWFSKEKFYWKEKEFHRPSASFSNKEKGTELLILNYDPETGIKI